MSSITTSLSGNGLAVEAARLAQAQLAAQQSLPPNTTITASYSFTVGSDGSLTPTQAQIVTRTANSEQSASGEGDPSSGQQASLLSRQTYARLSDVIQPRAQLSPSAESALFTVTGESDNATDNAATDKADVANATAANATDDGAVAPRTLAARLQISTASLYARNADIVYNIRPVIDAAA